MRRSQPQKALTSPAKGAGKVIQHNLKGKTTERSSPNPGAGKGQKSSAASPNPSAQQTGGATLGFPTPPTFSPQPLTYNAVNPFTTPLLKLQLDMPLLSSHIPNLTLPRHPTLTTPFHFYSHNEAIIKNDFARLMPYVELLLLGFLRINHVIQEAACVAPHLYPQDCDDHSVHHPRIACCLTVTRQKGRVDHSLNHLWSVVSRNSWNSYSMEEQLTIQRINTYLYAAIKLTPENVDMSHLPTFPLLQNR
eukprot:1238879-Amphidinium_carterae.1